MFSKACEYGIKATLFIAKQAIESDQKIGVKAIAKAINSPEAFTAKIMQILSREGVVKSMKGPSGGFYIQKEDLSKLKLSEVVEAIDGNQIFRSCSLGMEECNEDKPCPLHAQFKVIREALTTMLTTTTLLDLASGLNSGHTFLKI